MRKAAQCIPGDSYVRPKFMQGDYQVNSNEAEDAEVVNNWEEQVRKEVAEGNREGHRGGQEKASGSSEGHRGYAEKR